jgi:hypothetical protein
MVSERYRAKHGTAKDNLMGIHGCPSKPEYSSIPNGEVMPKQRVQSVQLNGYTGVFSRNEKSYVQSDALKIEVDEVARVVRFRDVQVQGMVCVVPFESVLCILYEETNAR